MAAIIERSGRHAYAVERPLKELVADMGRDARLLVHQEIALAKAELRAQASRAARGGAAIGASAVLAHAGSFALVAALILGLVAWGVAAWLATLLVAVAALGAALVLVQKARHTLAGGLAPRRTAALARETVHWAKERLS